MRHDHAKFPLMSDEEMANFIELCERTKGDTQGFYNPDSGYLLMAKLNNGRITGWHLSGPLSERAVRELGIRPQADRTH